VVAAPAYGDVVVTEAAAISAYLAYPLLFMWKANGSVASPAFIPVSQYVAGVSTKRVLTPDDP